MRATVIIHCLFLTFLLVSCKKEDNSDGVAINLKWEISSPVAFGAFQLPAVIPIIATVSSDENISRITIQLNNEQVGKIGNGIRLNTGSNQVEIDTFLTISDNNLPEGEYYLSFIASSAKGSKEEYRKLYLNQVPLNLKSIYLVSISDQLYEIKDSGLIESYNSPLTIGRSYLHSRDNLIFLLDTLKGEAEVVNLDDYSVRWRKTSAEFSSKPLFSDAYLNEGELFFSLESGRINGINKDEQGIFSADAKSGFVGKKFLKTADKLISIQESLFSSEQLLRIYYYPSGEFYNEKKLVGEVLSIFKGQDDELIIVRNGNGGGNIRRFNTATNSFEFGEINFSDKIIRAVQLDQDHLVVISGQRLYKVNVKSDSRDLLGMVHAAIPKLAYEKLNETIWEYDENSAYVFSVNQVNQQPTVRLFDKKVGKVLFYYNK